MPLQKNVRLVLAILYFLFISALFVLPGSAFPQDDWMSKIWFDKWVHIGLFIGLAVTWSWAMNIMQPKYLGVLLLLFALYGIIVELVQHHYVANRSFDVGDWIADLAGSVAGLWFWYRRFITKR